MRLTGEISWIKVGKCILENKKSMYKKRGDMKTYGATKYEPIREWWRDLCVAEGSG